MSQPITTLQTFEFHSQTVRVAGTPDEPLFVANDVCRILHLGDVRQALNGNEQNGSLGLDEDEKGMCRIYTPGGEQSVRCVTESGLYALIFKSRTKAARAFRKWVTSEVLPALRRTGRYAVTAIRDADEPAEADVPRLCLVTVDEFMAAVAVQAWGDFEFSERDIIAVGNQAKGLARAIGTRFSEAEVPDYGPLRTHPEALLRRAYREVMRRKRRRYHGFFPALPDRPLLVVPTTAATETEVGE